MSEPSTTAGGTTFEPIRITWEATPFAARLRLGLVALATDHTSETELHRMLPADGVDLFVTRVHYSGYCDPASLRAMGDELAAAAELLLPGTPLDGIAWGCTSGTAALGFERVASTIRAARPGVTVTTPLSAAGAAFRTLGVGRVAVLTPYSDEVNRMIVERLEEGGIRVPRLATFDLRTDREMWTVPPEAIEAAVADMEVAGAEAVFVSCTALRSALAIAPLERRIGLPVITSNQAMLWEMLRSAGYAHPIQGFGRLLADPIAAVPA